MLQSLRCYFSMIKRSGSLLLAGGLMLCVQQGAFAQNCTLACNNQVNVSIGSDCEAEITYDIILEGEENSSICSPNAPSDFQVEVMFTPDGPNIPESPIVNENYVGETLYVRITHLPTGNFCVGSILVINQLLPSEVNCPPDRQLEVGISTDPMVTGLPTEDDCADLEITYEDTFEDMSMMCNEAAATLTRTWTLTNPRGSSLECEQIIEILRPDVENVTFPPNLNGVDGAFLECQDVDTDPDATGYPNVNGTSIEPGQGLYGVTTTYRDEIVPNCGGTYTIVRTWTVVDPCSGNVARFDQVILVKDSVPPVLTCPTDTIRVSTNSQTDCTSDVLIPEVVVTDDCSEAGNIRILSPVGDFNGNGGILTDVPIGTHEITYEAEDECGNVGSCSFILVVEDRTAPTIVGDDRVTVAINDDGVGIVRPDALVIDAYDNCCPVTLEMRRMEETDEDFRSVLQVECTDVGQEIMVVVRGMDCFGNTNFSMIPVEVIYKLPPTVFCPPDIALQCESDYTDLEVTGQPVVDGICDEYNVTYEDLVQIDDCGQGVVLRTWSVAGSAADPVTCTQRIELIDTVALQITYPPEFTTDQCMNPGDLHPDNMPEPFGRPQIEGDGCKMLAVGHFDRVLSVNDEVCAKILRTWTVIDWCQFNPNDPDSVGYFEGTQLIKIEDITPPEFVCPDDIVFELSDEGADTLVLPDPVFDECLKDQTQFIVSGDLGPGLVHPNVEVGVYNINYTMIDICGNTRNCTFQVRVEEPTTGGNTGDSPMANCIAGLTISIQSDGLAEIWANDFDDGSKDDTTPSEDLLFRMGPEPGNGPLSPPEDEELFYSCADTGIHVIAMWVGDGDGNWDYCLTLLEIIDEDNFCDGAGNGFTVAGQVNSPTGEMVDGIEVSLENSNFPAQRTEEKGEFRFSNVPPDQTYALRLGGKGDPLNGVNTRDLIAIQKHVLGIAALESPYQRIAADTDGSGELSTVDLIAIQRLILGIDSDFRSVDSWRFVPMYHHMPEVTGNQVPFVPERLDLPGLDHDMFDADFVAVKIGDVTFDAVFANKSASPRSMVANRELRIGEPVRVSSSRGHIQRIPVRAVEDMSLAGLQFSVRSLLPDLKGITVSDGLLEQVQSYQNGALLNLVWASAKSQRIATGEVLFYLELPGSVPIPGDRKWLTLYEQRIPAMAVDDAGATQSLRLQFGEEVLPDLPAVTVVPNPFRNHTMLDFQLHRQEPIVLRVWNMSGQLVYERRATLDAGNHQWLISRSDLDQTGSYYYQIQTSHHLLSGQIVRQ